MAKPYDIRLSDEDRLLYQGAANRNGLKLAAWMRMACHKEARREAEAQGREPPLRDLEIRRNDDGSLDEIVGTGQFHLEQMDCNSWWIGFYPQGYKAEERVAVFLNARGEITANLCEEP